MEIKEIFRYRNLVVYQHARAYVKYVYELLKKFPKNEEYALCDQLRRASFSIPSNIAEGSGRKSRKEQIHFLEIAYASLLETICQMEIAFDLGYINESDMSQIEEKALDIIKMLSGWRRKILSLI